VSFPYKVLALKIQTLLFVENSYFLLISKFEMNDPLASSKLRHYYVDKFNQIDVLCLQEHKLRNHKVGQLGRQVWKEAHFLACEASLAGR
jgi:hypothetical protein